MRAFDGRTHRILIARPRLHSMQCGNKELSWFITKGNYYDYTNRWIKSKYLEKKQCETLRRKCWVSSPWSQLVPPSMRVHV